MDPLSIVSLVGNIAQFMSIGYAVISTARKIYYSKDNATAEVRRITLLVQDLKASVDRISKDLELRKDLDSDTAVVRDIAIECDRLSTSLLAQLEKLHIGSKKLPRGLDALRIAGTIWRKEKGIDDVLKRLAMLESRLRSWWFDNLTEEHQNRLATDMSSVLADLKILKATAGKLEQDMDYLEGLKEQLDIAVNGLEFQTTRQAVDQIITGLSTRITALQNTADLARQYAEEIHVMKRHQIVLDSLVFESLWERQDRITDAYATTLSWIYDRRVTSFRSWLEVGTGIYWINGLAGCGKSTAMKFILSTRQTMECLQSWTENSKTKLLTASYFFWNSGTDKQKSQQGLFQTLLYHIFRAAPKLLETLCPHRTTKEPWSIRELKDTMQSLQHQKSGIYICFFVDGLDEYHGDEEDIIKVVRDLAACSWMKICVSSRPWPAFQDQWRTNPNKLNLQDFTRNDMRIYVQNLLQRNTKFQSVSSKDSRCLDLIPQITERSEGIWLWVHLVVRELLRDVRDNEPYKQLRRRLDSYPTQLSAFFNRMMARIDRLHAQSAARLMISSIVAVEPLSISALVLLEEDDDYAVRQNTKQITDQELQELYSTWQSRLQKRCRDLMKLTRDRSHVTVQNAPSDFHEYRLQFLHRSVRDYLLEEQMSSLRSQVSETFDARLFLCRQKLLMLKRSKIDYQVQRHDVLELLHYANEIENEDTSGLLRPELYEVVREMDKTMKWFGSRYQKQDIVAAQHAYIVRTPGRPFRADTWTKYISEKEQQWPDLPWLAASAGLTDFIVEHIATHSDAQYLSQLLAWALGLTEFDIGTKDWSELPVFVRNANTIKVLIRAGPDRSYETTSGRHRVPWSEFKARVPEEWDNYTMQSRQVAFDLFKEILRQTTRPLAQWDGEDLIYWVREDLGEVRMAQELLEIFREQQALRQQHPSLSGDSGYFGRGNGRFMKLVSWTGW